MDAAETLQRALVAGDWVLAERLLMRAAKAGRAEAPVLYNLGRVMMQQGKWAPARIWLKRALARAPGHANAWFELGRVELELGDLQTAGVAFAKCLDLAPGDADARMTLGRIALRLGAYEQVRAVLAPLAGRDGEVDAMLYRAAAELRLPEAAALQDKLWQGDRVGALRAVTRASKGRLRLDL